MKTEHPILFSGPLVAAILAGKKTVTRRLVRFPKGAESAFEMVADGSVHVAVPGRDGKLRTRLLRCPYGGPGHALWVRETWWQAGRWGQSHPEDDEWSVWHGTNRVLYAVDGDPPNEPNDHWPTGLANGAFSAAGPFGMLWRKRVSIHMPRKFSRITLRVTGVRVERLHDLDEADAVAEGIRPWRLNGGSRQRFAELREGGDPAVPWDAMSDTARARFELLWQKINGKRAPWLSNPWVWRVAFEVIDAAKGAPSRG